ncbi:MAG: hypothetical protein M2R46_00403 [Verrucomicrobia subdivision 3 bacterium]|nr:hypothetical protein [Limisphaerales bacterium]
MLLVRNGGHRCLVFQVFRQPFSLPKYQGAMPLLSTGCFVSEPVSWRALAGAPVFPLGDCRKRAPKVRFICSAISALMVQFFLCCRLSSVW